MNCKYCGEGMIEIKEGHYECSNKNCSAEMWERYDDKGNWIENSWDR